MLRHCLAPSLRRQLNELQSSLDDTHERVLKEIQSTNQGLYAHRLLQSLVVAIRPLRVYELAEVLSYDLDATKGDIPTFHPEWQWEEQEQAVLSACSSLISIVDDNYSRVVQFSHFSSEGISHLCPSCRLERRHITVPHYSRTCALHTCPGISWSSTQY